MSWSRWLFVIGIVCAFFYIYNMFYKTESTVNTKYQQKIDIYTRRINELERVNQYISVQPNNLQNIDNKMETYKQLGYLYRDGVPDRYDENNNKLKGIPPNATKAIYFFKKAHSFGYIFGLYKVAKILHYGMHNLQPDLNKALSTYTEIAQSNPSPQLKQKATAMVRELEETLKVQTARRWLNLDWKHPNAKSNNSNKQVKTELPTHTFFGSDPMQNLVRTKATANTNPVGFQELFTIVRPPLPIRRRTRNNNNNADPALGVPNEEENLPVYMRNDLHNVHDSGVVGSIRNSIQMLQDKTDIKYDVAQTVFEIRKFLNRLSESDKKHDALLALDAIERSCLPLSSTNIKEVDALSLVWNRINSDYHNDDNKKQLHLNLIAELAECIEHGEPVCSTGRFTRMLDTLNVIDPLVNIKPSYIITNEMMEKCCQIRDNLLKEMPQSEIGQLDSLSENPTQIDFKKRLQESIRKELKKDYVDTNILSHQQLENELLRWIDSI